MPPDITPWLLVGVESSLLGGEVSISGAVRVMTLSKLSVVVNLSVATEIPCAALHRPNERVAFSVRRPQGPFAGPLAVGRVEMCHTVGNTWMITAPMRVPLVEEGWHTFAVHGRDDERVLVETPILVRLMTTPVWTPPSAAAVP